MREPQARPPQCAARGWRCANQRQRLKTIEAVPDIKKRGRHQLKSGGMLTRACSESADHPSRVGSAPSPAATQQRSKAILNLQSEVSRVSAGVGRVPGFFASKASAACMLLAVPALPACRTNLKRSERPATPNVECVAHPGVHKNTRTSSLLPSEYTRARRSPRLRRPPSQNMFT